MEVWIWIAAAAVFGVVEVVTVALVSVWFAVGAVAALAAALLGAGLWLQLAVFFVVSLVLLLGLRRYVRQTSQYIATNVDSVVGQTAVVTAAIDNLLSQGQVKLGAMEWSARSTSGKPIAVGSQVRVDRVEGVKVFVTPVGVPANVK